MFAPITPFVTEKIYQEQYKKYEKTKSIHICEWPKEFDISRKKEDDEVYSLMIEALGKVRQEKSLAKKSMNSQIILFLDKNEKNKLEGVLDDLKAVTSSKEIRDGKFRVEFS
jgi:valyl-tRNA synthetase